MTEQIFILERDALWVVWTGVAITLAMACAVVVQRLWLAIGAARRRHLERRYGPFLEPALDGDDAATRVLVSCPPAHRIPIARLLLMTTYATSNWEFATMFALAVERASAGGAGVIIELTLSCVLLNVDARGS